MTKPKKYVLTETEFVEAKEISEINQSEDDSELDPELQKQIEKIKNKKGEK